MRSIRKTLLLWLMPALVVISLITGTITYYTTRHEVEELLAYNLTQIGRALQRQQRALVARNREHPAEGYAASVSAAMQPFSGEHDFLIHIWHGADLLYSSHNLQGFPRPVRDGFEDHFYNDETWHSYALHVGDTLIQVAQPIDMQNDMVGEVVLSILIPLLVQLPILAALIWLVVGRSLRPLTNISTAIGKRSSTLLEPLPETEAPTEILPLIRELNALLQRLDASLQAQRQLTADAAHELRTPLTAIQLQLDILQRAKNDTEKTNATAKLAAGIQRSVYLVRQLLLLARMEPSAATRPHQPTLLAPLAQSVSENFAQQAAEKSIVLAFKADASPTLSADAESIQVLLNNLVDNALRYTPAGGEVHVTVGISEGRPSVSVSDSGIGIPADERGRIFDRFYRIPGSATLGTGLGLSIVQNIAEQHQASIAVTDGPNGTGTRFTVLFPTI